jgi:hypothetical protein
MEILLSPSYNSQGDLAHSYGRAIKSSRELHIASAFLTHWSTRDKLCAACQKLLFVVGTDFGLTRKRACENVLKWLPKKFKSEFLAVPSAAQGSFHPKVMVWQDLDNRYWCIVGSSNLTEAAFNSNFEANIEVEIEKHEYNRIVEWIENIARDCQVINLDWLKQYTERSFSSRRTAQQRFVSRVIQLPLPTGAKYEEAIARRRKQQRAFKEIQGKLLAAMEKCSSGSMSDSDFWVRFKQLWSGHESRLQGRGLERSAKNANWRQACKITLHILSRAKVESEVGLDRVVRQEIDSLFEAGNPVRGAWLSEMLCHYFPDRYPLLNHPIKEWLKRKRWKAQRGSSEGSAYIELARKLREVIRQNKGGPRNLAELDTVIWTAINS